MTKQLPQTSQELGLSSVTAVNCGHPLPASAPEVAPWDSPAAGAPTAPTCPQRRPPPPMSVGLSRAPHPASDWGFLEEAWRGEKQNVGNPPQAAWALTHSPGVPSSWQGKPISCRHVKGWEERGPGQLTLRDSRGQGKCSGGNPDSPRAATRSLCGFGLTPTLCGPQFPHWGVRSVISGSGQ